MSTLAFLQELRAIGIELEVEDGRLQARARRGALTPELASRIRACRDDLLAFLLAGRAEWSASVVPPVSRAPRSELMPLSFTQERLWYLSQVEENPAVFNLPLCFRIEGNLSTEALQRALNTVIERHEALRTTIEIHDGVGYQRIRPPVGQPLREFDVRSGNPVDGQQAARDLLDRETSEPFVFDREPAVRATLVRSGDREWFFLLVIHHMFVDGTSHNVLMEELLAAYEAWSRGELPRLNPVSLQFADYAVWQRGWLQGKVLEEQLAFWREELGGELPTLDLPTDFPRPALRGSRGAKEPFRLPKEATHGLFATAHQEQATPFMAMVAAFNALLYRYTGQEDLIVGIPVANRGRLECETIVGYIANTLVLRTDCSGASTFRELVRRVRKTCIRAFRHQDMPFQKIVEAINPPRDLSRTPIFQAFLTYDEVFVQPTRMGDLTLERVIVGSTVARQDVSLFLRRVGDEVHGSLEYSVDLFERGTALELIGHLAALVESAAASPDTPIAQLDIRTSAEKDRFAALNATSTPLPEQSLHELFDWQAAATPDKSAVACGGQTLTYGELRTRATRLASALRENGVSANDLVGVCLNRGVDMIVALLGVLKAGAAYVPLDPDFPATRLSYMLDDADIRVVVCEDDTKNRVAGGDRLLIAVGEASDVCDQQEDAASVSPDSRAYVIYTSGSTGNPKGVEVTHRSLVNFVQAMRKRPGMSASDVLVAVTTLSFDIAALELFVPLATGATVVVAAKDVVNDGRRLAQLLDESSATIMQATPATWRMLLDANWSGRSDMRALCGGEPLNAELAANVLARVRELWNMYGPTETTVWSTCVQVADPTSPISIGTPIANTSIRVVDAGGRQTPVGVPGELLIGGDGVAKGYLGRPNLTAERFVEDPTGLDRGRRFYRTGDRVRIRWDGSLQHLGRSDDQIKLNGYRIELGEIEATLESHEAVREAAAALHGLNGNARLIAYVAYHSGPRPTVTEIRRFLRDRLPHYMVPGMLIELAAIPRTPNGKRDRRRLPDPGRATSERRHVPVTTPMEVAIAEAWRSVLGIDQIGRTDNFFELGGHSLLSIRAVAAVEQKTGTRLDPRLLFFQTVEQLAARLQAPVTVA